MLSKHCRQAIIFFLIASFIGGCESNQNATSISESSSIPQASSMPPTSTAPQPSPTLDISKDAFSESVDSVKHYLLYLHGKIIEDQGIPAISPDHGEYEYKASLEKLSSYGFVVISEQRAKNTDSMEYAKRASEQITTLLDSGVPAKNITVIGASKGGGIAILISHMLENKDLNFVIMSICSPANINDLEQNKVSLYGNVLSIYDSSDDLAGSCQDLFSFSKGKGLSKHNEIVLNIGTGHGILFKPLDEWIVPAVKWAE
jgi:hypothetical protein